MKRSVGCLCLLLLFMLVAAPTWGANARQDSEELQLTLRKDFGYNLGDRVQGRFTISARGPDDLRSVTFLLDGEVIGIDDEPPFEIAFRTADFSLGVHSLVAVGSTDNGEEILSPERRLEFVSAEQGWQSALGILIPIFVLILVAMILGFAGPALLGRRRIFHVGEYGMAGGAVCPRCGLPYNRSMLSPNLLVGKLGRCPHCGKWAVVRRATAVELQAAETRWRKDSQQGMLEPDDEQARVQRSIEESRYEQ